MNSPHVFLRTGSLCAVALLLVSCVQTVRQKPPVQLQQAERHNKSGIAAESRQRFKVAEFEFNEAYRLFSTVENYHGMVTSLVNSSRLYRRLNDIARMEKTVNLAVALLPHTPELEAEVCFEMTKLALLKGDYAAAVNWSGRGVTSAAAGDRGRMLNLLAIVHLQKADLPEAGEIARAALSACRRVEDRREEANSFRILGEIAFAGNGYKEAVKMYEAALSIDKELALPGQISADLRGLARSYAAADDPESAAMHYQRSVSINMADRNHRRATEDLEMLRKHYESTNNSARLAETVELLEKIMHSDSEPVQR